MRIRLLVVLLLGLLLPASAWAQEQRPRTLEELSKACHVPLDVLQNLEADKLLSDDVYDRRNWLNDQAKAPKEPLLPLICWLAKGGDPDWPVQLTAIKVISLFGLLADREVVAEYALPLLETNVQTGGVSGQALRYSMEEVGRLNRWFRLDERIAPILWKHFNGKDFNVREFAYRYLCDLKSPRLIEEMVLPATWTVFKSKKGFGLFSRRRACRMFVRHEVREALPSLQRNIRHDGTVAIVSAYGLARFLDPSSLKELRKVDKTAVHRLRIGCWLARCRLNDKKCLKQIVKLVESRTEHDEIKRTFVADLGAMTEHTNKVRQILHHLKKHKNPAVRLGAALGLLKSGDDAMVDLVVETLQGPWPDLLTLRWRGKGWKRQFGFMESILRIEHQAANKAIIGMIDIVPKSEDLMEEDGKTRYEEWWRHGGRRSESMEDWYNEYKADAVLLCGERKIAEALPRLQKVSKDEWGHLKFHAFISRIELGDEKALSFLKWFLPKYDDRHYRQIRAIMGKTTLYTERMKWSSVFDVCEKFERVGDKDLYIPLLEELLQTEHGKDDPMKAGWTKRVGGDRTDASGTRVREKDPTEDPLFRPPEVNYRLRNQFARRAIVECAAKLAGAEAAPQLARALRDSRATVRAAAMIEIGRISGVYELGVGAPIETEREVWPAAVEWLKGQGAWPE